MSQHSRHVQPQRSCTVRPARPGDFNAMAGLALQLGYECTGEEIEERLSHMQDPNCYAIFVAEVAGGQIAGWIGAYLFRSVETESCAEINGLVVEQSIRSRGIGRLLLDAAEEWGRRIGCDTMSVRSNVKRDRAHRFYESNGYRHTKTQKEFRKTLR
jgi:GNAT superfamily N-acetyltransferase